MTTITALGLDGLRRLDEISDRNLVWYYRDELERIDKGMYSTLAHRERRKLVIRGLLSSSHRIPCQLTDKCRRILESFYHK